MNQTEIHQALEALAEVDSDVARALPQVGYPVSRVRDAGFGTFLSIIVSQQLSTESARAIMGRVDNLLGVLTAERLLSVEPQALREAGLSFRKIEYAQGLAEAVASGQLDIDALSGMSDEDAINAIIALRGFGRWSAEIYLMFSLDRRDIFPADDLALLVALGRLKRLDSKPTPKQAREILAHWSPWRSAGSLFLWHYYRGAPA